MNDVLEEFKSDNQYRFSDNTMQAYIKAVQDFIDYCQVSGNEVDRKQIKGWVNRLVEEEMKPASIHLKISALKTFFEYCIDQNEILFNPALNINLPKADPNSPDFLNDHDLFLLKEAARKNVRDRAIIETMLATGVRVSELINIHLEDIQWEIRQIWIRKGKGTKERFVLFTPECCERLKEYLKTRQDENPYLFITKAQGPFTRQSIHKLIKKYASKAALSETVSPHTLRHTFATQLASKGAPIEFIAELLGHENINTTKIYANLTLKIRKQKYDEYH